MQNLTFCTNTVNFILLQISSLTCFATKQAHCERGFTLKPVDTHIYYVTSFHQALYLRQNILHGGRVFVGHWWATCLLSSSQTSWQTRRRPLGLHAFLHLRLQAQKTGVVSHLCLLLPCVCLQIITKLPVLSRGKYYCVVDSGPASQYS